MKSMPKRLATIALALSLTALPLTACSGGTSDPSDASTDTTEATGVTAASVDVSSWKTVRDAYAAKTEELATASDPGHFIAVIKVGDATARVVAKLDDGMYDQIAGVDFLDPEQESKLMDIIGDLPLESAEDITADEMPREQLDALVGKTGTDLINEGFVFSSYYFYGAEGECGAMMDKGYHSYGVNFATTVTEEQTEDGGAAIMDAKVTSVEPMGVSNSAMDPTALEN